MVFDIIHAKIICFLLFILLTILLAFKIAKAISNNHNSELRKLTDLKSPLINSDQQKSALKTILLRFHVPNCELEITY